MNEIDWINFLKSKVKKTKNIIAGIGDDCALVRLNAADFLLKSDLFIEGVHFNLKDSSLEVIGSRAVSRVLSDFAACGGKPRFIGVSIGVPSYINQAHLKRILGAVLKCAGKYGFTLVGGDTSRSKKLVLDVWGVGVSRRFIPRNGAKAGDYIFLTGQLGKRKFNKKFEPRLKEAGYLNNNFRINSMIDITDGFILDLSRILEASRKGALLFKKAIPLVSGDSDLYRGEDYELIFTVGKDEKKINTLKNKFYLAGMIMPESFGYKIQAENKIRDVKVKGYLHF